MPNAGQLAAISRMFRADYRRRVAVFRGKKKQNPLSMFCGHSKKDSWINVDLTDIDCKSLPNEVRPSDLRGLPRGMWLPDSDGTVAHIFS